MKARQWRLYSWNWGGLPRDMRWRWTALPQNLFLQLQLQEAIYSSPLRYAHPGDGALIAAPLQRSSEYYFSFRCLPDLVFLPGWCPLGSGAAWVHLPSLTVADLRNSGNGLMPTKCTHYSHPTLQDIALLLKVQSPTLHVISMPPNLGQWSAVYRSKVLFSERRKRDTVYAAVLLSSESLSAALCFSPRIWCNGDEFSPVRFPTVSHGQFVWFLGGG